MKNLILILFVIIALGFMPSFFVRGQKTDTIQCTVTNKALQTDDGYAILTSCSDKSEFAIPHDAWPTNWKVAILGYSKYPAKIVEGQMTALPLTDEQVKELDALVEKQRCDQLKRIAEMGGKVKKCE